MYVDFAYITNKTLISPVKVTYSVLWSLTLFGLMETSFMLNKTKSEKSIVLIVGLSFIMCIA